MNEQRDEKSGLAAIGKRSYKIRLGGHLIMNILLKVYWIFQGKSTNSECTSWFSFF